MRRALSGLLSLSILLLAAAGCAPSATKPPASGPTAPAPGPTTPPSAVPTEACTPGSSAVDLPSGPYGSGPTLKPPQPGGTPARPWLAFLSVDQMEPQPGGGMLGTIYMRKGGTATVDVGAFWLRGMLMPAPAGDGAGAPSSDWFGSHLLLEGVTATQANHTAFGDQAGFDYAIPPGRPGDTFRLTVRDVLLGDGTSGDVVVTFCRQAAPEATVTYKAGDEWRLANPMVPAGGPLTLRVAFSREMLPETVERSLKGPHDKEGRSQGDWIDTLKWVDGRTLELTAAQAPPVLQLNLRAAQDRTGLFVARGPANLYSGEPPHVVAVDPASGDSRRLADLAPEPQGASLSPDGKLLRVVSQQFRPGADGPVWQVALVDLSAGTARQIQPDEFLGYWLPSGEMLDIRREGEDSLLVYRYTASGREETLLPNLPQMDSFYGSPDGKWVAVLQRTGNNTPDSHEGARFIIVSTDGKSRKSLDGEVRVYRPGKDGIMLYGPAWSPDNTRLALTQEDGDGVSLVVADVPAGTVRTIARKLPGSRGSYDPVTWSPDSARILVGPLLIDAATGQVQQRIDGITAMPYWSRDGLWLLFQSGDWTGVTAYHLPSGRRVPLGDGRTLGWSPEGQAMLIRWPSAAYRTIWGY